MTAENLAPAGPGGISPACPLRVERPVMRQRWERLTFLHWSYDPAVVQRLLPDGLQADLYDGLAWVGLVPFFMRVHTPGGRGAPWVSNFCETNVRTYVRDQAGRPGIWFLSLDAARAGAVAVARASYGLPYFWSSMGLSRAGRDVSYHCRRRVPGPGAVSEVRVRIGEAFDPASLGDQDHFLTARWRLFSVFAGRQLSARAEHQPWPLYRAEALAVRDGLIPAAGPPAPAGDPLVHYSPGVDVRIGLPERSG